MWQAEVTRLDLAESAAARRERARLVHSTLGTRLSAVYRDEVSIRRGYVYRMRLGYISMGGVQAILQGLHRATDPTETIDWLAIGWYRFCDYRVPAPSTGRQSRRLIWFAVARIAPIQPQTMHT